jgi:hypothetical protein
MSEVYTYGLIVGAVVAIVLILYVMDRRGKNEPVDVMDGAKVVGGAGALTAGVVYALGGADAAEPMVAAVQDMFTGKPSF